MTDHRIHTCSFTAAVGGADFKGVCKHPALFLGLMVSVILIGLSGCRTAPSPQRSEKPELEPRIVMKKRGFSTEAQRARFPGDKWSGGVKYESAERKTEGIHIQPVDVAGMLSAVAPGSSSQFEDEGPPGYSTLAVRSSICRVHDAFTLDTVNAFVADRTLVVLMLDRSLSVVHRDFDSYVERMTFYLDKIDSNMPGRLREKGHWQVVSYGAEVQFHGEPTSDVSSVVRELKSIQGDWSGVENLAGAVGAVLDRFEDADYEHILIAAMTDEAGNDLRDPSNLQRVTERMRQQKARFYVFGRESVFSARKENIRVKLDMDRIRDGKRKALMGLEDHAFRGWIDAGPESPRAELWWCRGRHRWKLWGGTLNGIPSGFGVYTLNWMVWATGGTYFQMRDESDYNLEKLYPRYEPDVCSPTEYDRRVRENPLRRELTETWKHMGNSYLSCDLASEKAVRRSLRKAKQYRRYCIRQAKVLQTRINESNSRARNRMRWIAHAEITRAELVRMQFLLGQYYLTLAEAQQKHGDKLDDRKRVIRLRPGTFPDDLEGIEPAKKERRAAAKEIAHVIEKHKGTPWAVLANRMQENLHPWRATLGWIYPGHRFMPDIGF